MNEKYRFSKYVRRNKIVLFIFGHVHRKSRNLGNSLFSFCTTWTSPFFCTILITIGSHLHAHILPDNSPYESVYILLILFWNLFCQGVTFPLFQAIITFNATTQPSLWVVKNIKIESLQNIHCTNVELY